METSQPNLVRIYTPESALRRPGVMLREMGVDFIFSIRLGWQLGKRDIQAQYRQSFFGFLWAVLPPLVMALLFIGLKKAQVMSIEPTPIPYECFVMVGSLLWHFFTDALTGPLKVVGAAKSMLTKIHFPREALVLSSFYQTLFRSLIRLVILLGVLLYFGEFPRWQWGGALLLSGVLLIMGLGVGLFLTPVGLLYHDFGNSLPLLLGVGFLATPVMYPKPTQSAYSWFLDLNPITPILQNCRQLLTGAEMTEPTLVVALALGAFLILLLSGVFYRISMPIIIERMGA